MCKDIWAFLRRQEGVVHGDEGEDEDEEKKIADLKRMCCFISISWPLSRPAIGSVGSFLIQGI